MQVATSCIPETQQPILTDKRGFFSEPFTAIRNSALGDYNAKNGVTKGLVAYLSGAEWKLYSELVRLIDGYQHRTEVRASYTALAELTGLGRKAVMRAAEGMTAGDKTTRLIECDTSQGVAVWSIYHENTEAFIASRCQKDSSVYQNDSDMGQNDSGEAEAEVSQKDSGVSQNDSAAVSKRLRGGVKMTPPSKKENYKKKKKKKEIKDFAPGASPENAAAENPPGGEVSRKKHLHPERHQPLMEIVAKGCGLWVDNKMIKADIIAGFVGKLRDAEVTVDEALEMTTWFKQVENWKPDPASYWTKLSEFRAYKALIMDETNQAMRQAYVQAWGLGKIANRLQQWELCQAMQGLIADYEATPEQIQAFPDWWTQCYTSPWPLFSGLAKHWPSFLRDFYQPIEAEEVHQPDDGEYPDLPDYFEPIYQPRILSEAEKVWQQVDGLLKSQMTLATYQSNISGMGCEEEGEGYVLYPSNPMSVDWLEHRLKNNIARVFAGVVGHDVEISFKAR